MDDTCSIRPAVLIVAVVVVLGLAGLFAAVVSISAKVNKDRQQY